MYLYPGPIIENEENNLQTILTPIYAHVDRGMCAYVPTHVDTGSQKDPHLQNS
jgi:hypothetical protein